MMDVVEGPLNKRAWLLQERLLSYRQLFLGIDRSTGNVGPYEHRSLFLLEFQAIRAGLGL